MAGHVLSVGKMVLALEQWKESDPTGSRDPPIGEMVGVLAPDSHRGAVAPDLSLDEVLNMAHRLQQEAYSTSQGTLIAQIADFVLVPQQPGPQGPSHEPRDVLLYHGNRRPYMWDFHKKGSFDWSQIHYGLDGGALKYNFHSMAQIEVIVCVTLVALSPTDVAVLMIKESSIRVLACALYGLTARGSVDDGQCKLSRNVRPRRTAEEVEAFCRGLASNRTLTSLVLVGEEWFCPAAGGRGIRHLGMLRNNSTLVKLRVFEHFDRAEYLYFPDAEDDDERDAGDHASPVPDVFEGGAIMHIEDSAGLKDLTISGTENDLEVDELLEMLGHLGALQKLHLDVKLCRGAGTSRLLEGIPMRSTCATSLRRLRLGMVGPGGRHLLPWLSANGTLESLSVNSRWDGEGCGALFTWLTPAATTSVMKHLTHLTTRWYKFHKYAPVPLLDVNVEDVQREVDALAAMIVANKVLLTLDLSGVGIKYSKKQWAELIIPALARNSTLRTLGLSRCMGVDADGVYDAMRSMLQVNTSLTKIKLSRTPLERSGKRAAIEQQLRQNKEYRAALAALPTMPVKSWRLVLCGYPMAGKTTLCDTMLTGIDTTRAPNPTFEQFQDSRTRGFQVNLLLKDPVRISLWDFGGQKQYYALHDLVFPAVNSSSLFLFVYSPVLHHYDPANRSSRFQYKDSKQFLDEFTFWLKFIASNARPGSHQPAGVVIAITFWDLLSPDLRDKCWNGVREVVQRLSKQFHHVIHVLAEPFFIDARCRAHVDVLMEAVVGELRSLVCKLPEVPTICEHIRLALDDWSLQNRRKPIMTTVEFQQLCHTVCKALMETPGVSQQHRTCLQHFMAHSNSWKVVASYLKDTGELIYFQDTDFIVVSPRWLGEGVLSHVITEFGFGGQHIPHFDMDVRGFLTKATLEGLLQKSLGQQEDLIRVESLIHLMLKMHLCYENRTPQNVVIGYFLPVLFHIHQVEQHSQGQTQLEWPSGTPDNDKHFFVGWRLQCGDPTCTFLTPGFFPRLQVMLYNHFLEFEQGWMQDSCANCKMDDNVFGIATHGLDILVEYSGSIEFYVDILARSIAPPIQSMKFLQEHVVKPIRSLCASDEGCTGVVLVEGIVRQECVKLLTLCRYRKEQSIPVEEMLRRVAASQQGGGEYYYHQWLEVAHKEAGQPPVLRACIEYATLLDGHIILGQEHEIEKAKVRVTQEETEDCYPDSNVKQGKKRGSAVLISMEKYQYGYRLGGEVDRGRLESLAESLHLKLYGNICLNLSADDLRETMIDTAQTGISAEDECFVCFVNAHGGTADDGAHYFKDTEGAKFFLLDDIVDPFRKCQNLFGKPKLFFVNSCRGPLELGSANGLGVEQRVPLQWSEGKEVRYAQQYSDCLIVFATSEHAVSIRDNEYGTNFVFALMQAFNNKRKTRDVLSMTTLLTHVVVDVEEEEEVSGHVKTLSQCPVVVTSLRKKLYWRSG